MILDVRFVLYSDLGAGEAVGGTFLLPLPELELEGEEVWALSSLREL